MTLVHLCLFLSTALDTSPEYSDESRNIEVLKPETTERETLKYGKIPARKSQTHASHNHRTHKSQIKTDTELPHTLHTRFPTPHDTHNARTLEPRNKETKKETLEAHHLLSQRIRPHTNRNHPNRTSQPRTNTEPPHDPHTHSSEPNNAHSTYTIEPRIGTDIIIIIATQGRVVYGERRHAEPPGGNDHPQLSQRLG
jgi:FtsZ-interacting cell division protein ZipA